MIQRFRHYRGKMRPSPDGRWVRYEDADELLDTLRIAARLLKDWEFETGEELNDVYGITKVLERLGR